MTELRDYAYSDDGTAISGVTVDVFVIGEATPTDTDTTDSTGMWEFTTLPADGYDVRLTNGSAIRWLRGDVSAQFNKITSFSDGITAPLENDSINVAMLKPIAANTTTVPTGNTNDLDVWVGRLLTVLKATTGETHWYDVPSTSLTTTQGAFATHTHNGTDAPQVTLHPITATLSGSLSVLNTAWVDGPSLSLTAGTWLITATVDLDNTQVINSSNFADNFNSRSSTVHAKLWDGTTDFAEISTSILPTFNGSLSLHAVETLAASATVKVSCKEIDLVGGIVHMNTGTRISAIRVQ